MERNRSLVDLCYYATRCLMNELTYYGCVGRHVVFIYQLLFHVSDFVRWLRDNGEFNLSTVKESVGLERLQIISEFCLLSADMNVLYLEKSNF